MQQDSFYKQTDGGFHLYGLERSDVSTEIIGTIALLHDESLRIDHLSALLLPRGPELGREKSILSCEQQRRPPSWTCEALDER